MNCEGCYKNGHCWACVLWFGCGKVKKTEGCFRCDKVDCPKKNTKEE